MQHLWKTLLVVVSLSSIVFFEQPADATQPRRRGSGRATARRASAGRVHYPPIPASLDNKVTPEQEAQGYIYKRNRHLADNVPQCPDTLEAMAGKLKPENIRIFDVVTLDHVLEADHPIKIQGCVIANTDSQAARYCHGRYSEKAYNILNPGNQQYSRTGRGEYNTNPDNYYYCISSTLNMVTVKQRVCSWIRDYYDNQLCSIPPTGSPTSSDITISNSGGITTSGEVDGSFLGRDADGGDYGQVTTNEDGGLSSGESSALNIIMSQPLIIPPRIAWNARHGNGDGTCECNGDLNCPDLAGTDITCMSAGGCPAPADAQVARVGGTTAPTVTTTPTAAPTQTAEVAVQQCIATEQQKADSCKTSIEALERTCAQTDEANRAVNAGSQAIGGLGRGVTSNMANSGQGTYGTCLQAGALALGASAALRTTQQQCAGSAQACEGCRSNQIANFLDGCARAGGFSNFSELRTAKPELAQSLTSAQTSLTEIYDRTSTTCEQRVPQQQNQLGQLLNGLGNTAQSATTCACQTSSSGGGNCSTIPTVDTCVANPAAPGCQAYIPASICAVGSASYDAATCGCVQNPSAAGCQTVAQAVTQSFSGNLAAGSAGISAFAGATTSLASAGGGGSGSSSNFSDLSGGGGGGSGAGIPANFANNLKQGEISTGGGATGASVGGGGGGSGGGSGAPATAADKPKEDDKGIKGLFNNAKTFLSNAFGGKGAKAAASKIAGNGSVDTNRFKPSNLRGVAQQRDIASQNEKTLFELVNECANGLRCRSTTTNTMMTGP